MRIETIRIADLIEIWERGANQPPYAQALLLLAAALPDQPVDRLAGWNIGRRDAALLALRESLFGDRLVAVAGCPRCGERIELNFCTADIRVPYAGGEKAGDSVLPTRQVLVDGSAYTVCLRAPTTHDLIEMARERDRAREVDRSGGSPPPLQVQDQKSLFYRLVVSAERENRPVLPADLPVEVLADCAQALAEYDPQADVQLALRCPDCGYAWEAPFDIVSYLWHEIETWVGRLLREVHLLASAYGWNEGDILSLSPMRRRRYLEMVVG